jgi:hypothetical protein
VTRGRGARRDGSDDLEPELGLEVIDLQPSDERSPREESRPSGVRGRRGPAIVAIVVIVALAGFTIARSADTSRRSSAHPTPTSDAGHTIIRLDGGPGAPAPLFQFRVGAQLLTGGRNGLRLVDTDTGQVTTPAISGLPLGSVTIVAHSGGTVAVRAAFQLFWFTMPSGRTSSVAHGVDGDTAFPAARRGYLWIASHRFATEVPGGRTSVFTTGPAIGETSAGLLVVTNAGVLLQPTSGTDRAGTPMLPASATVIGVHPDRVAWVSDDCGLLRCPVHVTEVSTRATTSWIQLPGHPSPLLVSATSAVFSPDGTRVAIAVPSPTDTSAGTLIVANLLTRATTVVAADGRFAMPERPGHPDATGMTVDWTLDGAFVTLAPRPGNGTGRPGNGRTGVVDPVNPVLVSSPVALDLGATAAVMGVSTVGPLDLPRHGRLGPIANDPPLFFATPGLSLLAADEHQIDRLDPTSGRTTTWHIPGAVPDAAGRNTIARVTGGWLVVRSGGTREVVDLLHDTGGAAREIAPGFEVFSSDHGRHAWISDPTHSQVWPYDPVTQRLGAPVIASGRMVALDRGLFVWENRAVRRFDVIDASGQVTTGPILSDPHPINVVAGAGTTIAFVDQDGLHTYDVTTQQDLVVSPAAQIEVAALSPEGTAIAWIENDATQSNVLAQPLGSTNGIQKDVVLGGPADRVLVTDDGSVLYTSGADVRRGRVDADGSSPVYGLAPDPVAELALG